MACEPVNFSNETGTRPSIEILRVFFFANMEFHSLIYKVGLNNTNKVEKKIK